MHLLLLVFDAVPDSPRENKVRRLDQWEGCGERPNLGGERLSTDADPSRAIQGLGRGLNLLGQRPSRRPRIAAAHLLAGTDPKMETRYLIRILLQDAAEVGLQVDDSAIGKTGVPWNAEQLQAELAVLVIPEETVALRARCLELKGQGVGSAAGNWEKAVNQLRDEYKTQYPHGDPERC